MTFHHDYIDDDTLVEAAREALSRDDGSVIPYHYWGSLPLWQSWGPIYGKSDDADTMVRSNWRVMLADLQGVATADDGDGADDASEYVDTFYVSGYGGSDKIAVRVLVDEDGGVTADNLTATFRHAVELAIYLRHEGPVLDESDWSELETEEQWAAWDTGLGNDVLSEIADHFEVDDVEELALAGPSVKFDGWNPIEYVAGDNVADTIRSAYYQHESTEWIEEGASFHNGRHEDVLRDLIGNLFVPRTEQIERAHSDAIREDTARTTGPNQLTLI